jgi:adenylosuccinate synthase
LAKLILVLSGPIAAGKTTLVSDLVDRFGFHAFKTNELLKQRAAGKIEEARGALQAFGESLDKKTKGAWVKEGLTPFLDSLPADSMVVVDSARIEEQIEAIRNSFGLRVIHIHLTAPFEVLVKRFKYRRKKGFREALSYEEVRQNITESNVESLAKIADVVIDTERSSETDVVVRAASHLGLYGREYSRLVDVLIGGEYGSEGKGHVASYLAREYDILIRVGGPNAGHKVFSPPYTFHQLPSGTTACEAKLILGPGSVMRVDVLLKEIGDCQVDAERLSIDPQAMIIEEADREGEAQLVKDIASTGQGVGWATGRRIIGRGTYAVIEELVNSKATKKKPQIQDIKVRLAKDIKELRPFIRPTYEELEKAFSAGKKIFLEGTQGTGLSLYHGMYPHVTSRDTTVAGCLAEAGISPSRVRKVIMVCRTYPIRVGNAPTSGNTSGPMSQEITLKEIARRSHISLKELNRTERTSTTNRERRISEFDWTLIRKAASLNAPTDISLSFVDYIDIANRQARRFEQLTEETIRFIEEVERVTTAPVSLITTRFHSRSIIDRRTW